MPTDTGKIPHYASVYDPHSRASIMNSAFGHDYLLARRRFLTRTSACLGMTAVASLLDPSLLSGSSQGIVVPGSLGRTHFAPKAQNVIYPFMGGGPSHVDTFDPKPILRQ